jgi:L-threonylcarbamoyladenylate synthase
LRVVKADLEGLALASEAVANGGLICFPTDTVYGLGCDPLNELAVKKTLATKGRGQKAMPVLVRGMQDAERLAVFSESARRLAGHYWPGPLTIVLSAKDHVPSILAPEGTIGLRSPRHTICLQLLGLCSGNLVGTSANLTGKPPSISVEQAVEQLGKHVDVVVDGGKSPVCIASTVIDLTQNHLIIVREGQVSRLEILSFLKGKSR